MSTLPIGVQLFSVRHNLDKNPQATLMAIAKMGYAGVEFFGPPKYPAETYKGWLDDAGLACCGWHVPFAQMQENVLKETIEFHTIIENHRLVVPGIPKELRTSREDWLSLVPIFDGLAKTLAKFDMVTGYHNHHHEFTPFDGEQPWDTLFSGIDPSVIMQLDTGNGIYGGAKILDIMARYPGRAKTVHLKPFDSRIDRSYDSEAGFGSLIGEDDTPWAEFFDLCESTGGTEWYIVEYESNAHQPMDAIKRCLDNLRGMGK